MSHRLRLSIAGTVVGIAGLLWTGCTPPPVDEPDAGVNMCGEATQCERNIDCGGGSICEKEADGDQFGCCVRIFCEVDDHCADTEKCDVRRGLCVPENICDPGNPEDVCASGQLCIYTDGVPQCVDDAPDAADCIIQPHGVIVRDGEGVEVWAAGRKSDGSLVPNTTFSYAADSGATVTGNVVTGDCGTGVCSGTLTATASPGGGTCTVSIKSYASVPAADTRVVVIDQDTGSPVSGAPVAIKTAGGLTEGTTNADGAYVATGVAAADVQAVSAFPTTHQWQTVVAPGTNDVLLYTVKIPNESKVAGVKGQFDFSTVTTQGDIKLGLAGMSINGAITDLDFATLIGEIADYNITLEGVTDPEGEVVPLPSGLVLELGAEQIKGDFITLGKPGTGVLWALGGKVRLSEIGDIISSVTASDDINVGSILAAVLPFFARFDHASVSGLELTEENRPASPGEGQPIPYGDWPFDELTGGNAVKLNTLLGLSATYDVPRMPCVPGAGTSGSCTDSAYASGAVLLSGVVVPGMGLVPLGLTAGLDDPDDQDANDQADGVLDYLPPDTGTATPSGKAIIDYAPPHDGLEGNLYVTIAIALDINGLTEGALGASTITHVTSKFDANNSFPNSFLEHQGGSFDRTTNTVSLTKVGTADFYRVNLENADDTNPGAWNIWFGGDTTSIDISTLRPGTVTGRDQTADIQAFKLGTGYTGAKPSTFGDLFEFNGTDLDNLVFYMGGWSSQECAPATTEVPNPHCSRIDP